MKYTKYLVVLLSVILPFNCVATVGSDSAVERFTSTQLLSNGERVATFAALEAGFTLLAATGVWDSVFPVAGPISLDCNTLQLRKDLIIHNEGELFSFGDINGNGYALSFSKSTTCFPITNSGAVDCAGIFSNIDVCLNCNAKLQATLTFTGDSTLSGGGHCLTLSPDGEIEVGANSTLLIKDITIKDVAIDNIKCLDSSATISLKNVTWVLSDDYDFDTGHFDVISDFFVSGQGFSFAYKSDVVSTIGECGHMIINQDVILSYDPSIASGGLLQLTEATSQLELRSATLSSTSTGLQLTKGNFIVKGKSFITSTAAFESEAIQFGDGISSANNLTVQILPGAQLEIADGIVIQNDA